MSLIKILLSAFIAAFMAICFTIGGSAIEFIFICMFTAAGLSAIVFTGMYLILDSEASLNALLASIAIVSWLFAMTMATASTPFIAISGILGILVSALMIIKQVPKTLKLFRDSE